MREMWIYVEMDNEEPKFFHIYENLDEELWDEDREEGFVDFFNYEVHSMMVFDGFFTASEAEEDSQMVLTTKRVQDMTADEILKEAVNDYFAGDVFDEVHQFGNVNHY